MSEFVLTEKWLGDSGGWAALKAAKSIMSEGAVLQADFDGKVLRGVVLEGRRRMACGLLIRGSTDVSNLCSCLTARSSGAICGHSISIGLAVLAQLAKDNSRPSPEPKQTTGRVAFATPPLNQAPMRARGVLSFEFAEGFPQTMPRGSVAISIFEKQGSEGEEGADVAMREWLVKMGQPFVPKNLLLRAEQAVEVFQILRGHPRLSWRSSPLSISDVLLRLPLMLLPHGNQAKMVIAPPLGSSFLAARNGIWCYFPEETALLECSLNSLAEADRTSLLAAFQSRKPWERSWRWFFQNLEALNSAFRLDTSRLPAMPQLRIGQPRFLLNLEGSLNHLAAKLSCQYDAITITPGDHGSSAALQFPYEKSGAGLEFVDRDFRGEEEAVAELQRAGFSPMDSKGQQALRGQNAILSFFASRLPRLQRQWEVKIGARFSEISRGITRVQPIIEGQGPLLEGGWLDVDIGYATSEGSRIPREEIQRLLRVGQSGARLANGKMVAIDLEACGELDEVLRDINPGQSSGRFRVPGAQMDYLLECFDPTKLQDLTLPPFPEQELPELRSVYREYQREGLRWLLARTDRGLSSVLADEMGLGKTLQTLGLIKVLRRRHPGLPCLLVAPTTLLENWRREAARFLPSLRCLVLHGSGRMSRFTASESLDLLITSYPLLARDFSEHYDKREFLAVILDEASLIRNPATQTAQAAFGLRAKFRVALTGTPIENSVRDIWSIMRFVAPGYLGGPDEFQQRYEQPLSSGAASGALRKRFRNRLRPFILRRTKAEVAKDLPPKIEQIIPVPLGDFQRDLYTEILRGGREELLAARRKGAAVMRMTMLTTLLRLRQVCCDVRLTGVETEERSARECSAKLAHLRQLLMESAEGGHRVLIFSQFVKMLRLIEESLKELELDYCYLDGQSTDRADQVDRFQTGNVPVFLISLKAGGYGLTLTAADTVIHFDPWWNPAVEAQATDRAHRIGQSKVVSIYKLITQDTVEDRIVKLQQKKRELIDAALDDDAPLMNGLTAEDLQELLSEN